MTGREKTRFFGFARTRRWVLVRELDGRTGEREKVRARASLDKERQSVVCDLHMPPLLPPPPPQTCSWRRR